MKRFSMLLTALCLGTLPATADACGICNSNLTYNQFPFTPAWLLIFVGWWLCAAFPTNWLVSTDLNSNFRMALKSGLKLLVVLLILLFFGMHLFASLFGAFILVRYLWKTRSQTNPKSPSSKPLFRRFTVATLIAMGISVPLSYGLLPKTLSEVETRATVSKTRTLLSKRGINEGDVVDSFAYTIFDIPILNAIVLSPGFYTPATVPDNKFRTSPVSSGTLVWSRGPDSDFDLADQVIRSIADISSTDHLASFSYDPTNGIISNGDIIELALSRQ